jgi:hypothetical protein
MTTTIITVVKETSALLIFALSMKRKSFASNIPTFLKSKELFLRMQMMNDNRQTSPAKKNLFSSKQTLDGFQKFGKFQKFKLHIHVSTF